jgi:signal transduction histidine kinase
MRMEGTVSPHRWPIQAVSDLPNRSHSVEFHDKPETLVDSAVRFIRRGLQRGEAAIVVATDAHLAGLTQRLRGSGIGIDAAVESDALQLREATRTLSDVMIDGMPDAARFGRFVSEAVTRARRTRPFRRIRAFSEMVGILRDEAGWTAMLRLEEMWTAQAMAHSLELLCGYRLQSFESAEDCQMFATLCDRDSRVARSPKLLGLDAPHRSRAIARLEQRAASLEAEIERSRHSETVKTRLYALAADVNAALSLEDVYEPALDAVGTLLGANRAAILVCDEAGALQLATCRHLPASCGAAFAAYSPWPADETRPRPVVVVDVQCEPPEAPEFVGECRALGIASVGFVPLVQRRQWLGALVLCAETSQAPFQRELRLAAEIAQPVSQAIYRTRLFETERSGRKAAEAAALARDELLAIVSHDLRNPLGVVMVGAANVQRECATRAGTSIHRSAEMIQQAATRMARLIADLLDLGSIRRGQFTVAPGDCGADEIVSAVVEMSTALIGDRELCIGTQVEGGDLLRCDRDRVIQALGNLLANAISVTGDGGVVTVGAHSAVEGFTFFVEDQGPGLEADEVPHLFERYWRSRHTGYHGTGLGLSIAKGIVEAHGGRIWAASAGSSGSRFSFCLPDADRIAHGSGR